MQATIATFDSDLGNGTVILDDGVHLPFPAHAWDGQHLRHLRPGQRVIIEIDDEPAVTSIRIH